MSARISVLIVLATVAIVVLAALLTGGVESQLQVGSSAGEIGSCIRVRHDDKRKVTCWVNVCGDGGAEAGISCIPDVDFEPDLETFLCNEPTPTAEPAPNPRTHGWK